MEKFMKPTVILDKPITPYDSRPEIWNIQNTNKKYLVYYPIIVSSHLISYKPTSLGYKFESKNTIYICDCIPTIRIVTRQQLNEIRNSI
tara:strand:+ start:14643 stop:14909 length:267 start_codon:yes stop_codon:yes gene_type:complete